MEKYLFALKNNGKSDIDRIKHIFHTKNVKSFSELQKKQIDLLTQKHKPNKSSYRHPLIPQSNKTINISKEDSPRKLSRFAEKNSTDKRDSHERQNSNPVGRVSTRKVIISVSKDDPKMRKLQKTSESTNKKRFEINKRIKTSISTNKQENDGDISQCHKPSVFLNTTNSRQEQRQSVRKPPQSLTKQPKKDLVSILKGFKEETLLMQKRQVKNSIGNHAIFQKVKEKTIKTQPSYMDKLNKLFRNKSPSNNLNSRIKEIRSKYFKDNYIGLNAHSNKKSFCALILKNPHLYENIDANLLFNIESLLSRFVTAAFKGDDVYDIFKAYMDFVQDNDIQPFLNIISCTSMQTLYKNALVIERLALMTIFYLLIHDFYESEITLIRKLIAHIYSNYYTFITLFINDPNCWGLFTVT